MNNKRLLPSIIVCLLVLGSLKGPALEANEFLPVGAAKVDATPRSPVVLAGYGSRNAEHEGIDTKLWARALVIGDERPTALVVLDNCGVPGHVVDKLAKRLAKHGVAAPRLVVAATHTHNAPSLEGYAKILWAGRTTPQQERQIARYTDYAIGRMEAAVVAALKARQPMRLEYAQGRVTFGGNRRVLQAGKWTGFGFQRSGPVDHSVPVLAGRDAQGKVRLVWTNYACHCTTVGSRNRVGGDWAGYANDWIEKEFPEAVALTTIGCGADVGPQPSGSLQLAEQHGRNLAQEVKRVLAGETTPLRDPPQVVAKRVKLPLADTKSREYWRRELGGRGFGQQLAKEMLRKLDQEGELPTEVDYPLSAWTFGDDLAVVFLAGEVVVDYSVRLKSELDWRRVWINAWSNDMPGYIPSRRVLAEGGYEADFSQIYYAQPGRYAPEIEDIVVGGVKQIVGDRFKATPNQTSAPFHRVPSGQRQAFEQLAEWSKSKKHADDESVVLTRLRKVLKDAKPAVGQFTKRGQATEWHNFAGDFVKRVFIRQQMESAELAWTTPAPSGEAQPLTLCFSGGVGWISQPKTRGFQLLVDDTWSVTFDVTRKPTRWASEDEDVELLYLPLWTSNEDSGGFFFLTLFKPQRGDGRLTVTVRSLGKDSQRWFAVDTDQQMPERLKKLRAALSME